MTGTTTLEDAFVHLLPADKRGPREPIVIPPRAQSGGEPAIVARGLTRRFGSFTAVDEIDRTEA